MSEENGGLPSKKTQQIAKLKAKHHRAIDKLLQDPTITNKDLAKDLKMTAHNISILRNSPTFISEYERRRNQMESNLEDRLANKLLNAAGKAVDTISKMMDDEGTADSNVIKGAETITKMADSFGVGRKSKAEAEGARKGPSGGNVTQVIVTRDALEAAKSRRTFIEGETIPHEQKPLPSPTPEGGES